MNNKLIPSILILILCVGWRVSAQTHEDSLAIVNADWKIIGQSEGFVCKQAVMDIFNSKQVVNYAEISPDLFGIVLVQNAKRKTPAAMGRKLDAVMAINAGFFRMDTNDSFANDYLKINDSIYPSAGGWGTGAFAIDNNGYLRFQNWDGNDACWAVQYPSVMVAGPMLLLNSEIVVESDDVRHPRTLIGTKPDSTVVMMVIDGRQRRMDGMSFYEAAYLSYALGLKECLNLDGGGSSVMWMDGKGNISNSSNRFLFFRSARKVANSVLILKK